MTTPPSSRILSGGPRSPAEARRFVEGRLCLEHARELSADAVLLASELVAQAMSAGARPRSLSLDCHVSRLEITVTTAGPRSRPVPSPHDRLRAFLIEQVALGWGTEERDGGLRLWCVFGSRVPVEVPQLI